MIWPGHEDMKEEDRRWAKGKVARDVKLEKCLEKLSMMIEKWTVRREDKAGVGVTEKLIGTWG